MRTVPRVRDSQKKSGAGFKPAPVVTDYGGSIVVVTSPSLEMVTTTLRLSVR